MNIDLEIRRRMAVANENSGAAFLHRYDNGVHVCFGSVRVLTRLDGKALDRKTAVEEIENVRHLFYW